MTQLPLINPSEETKKIVNFIRHTFQTAAKTQAIIAVSGGVDSATSLILATQALTPENVITLHLPAKNSTPIHTQHANLVMDAAKIPAANRLVIPIGSVIQKSWRTIKNNTSVESNRAGSTKRTRAAITGAVPAYAGRGVSRGGRARESVDPNDIKFNRLRLANLAARIRMTILFDQAKLHDALVIGTENRSEYLLGYYTRFGDEASDIEPIRHLYKIQVIQLAKHLGVPEPILTKNPTADLWPGQSDADELGFTYQEADPILYLIDQNQPQPDTPLAQKVKKIVDQNAFKHQVPFAYVR